MGLTHSYPQQIKKKNSIDFGDIFLPKALNWKLFEGLMFIKG